MSAPATTRLSTKGQLILPKAIREARRWEAGTTLTVEDTPDGVLIKAAKAASPFPPTRFEDVRGRLAHLVKKPLTLEDMDRAITEGVRRRRALGRY